MKISLLAVLCVPLASAAPSKSILVEEAKTPLKPLLHAPVDQPVPPALPLCSNATKAPPGTVACNPQFDQCRLKYKEEQCISFCEKGWLCGQACDPKGFVKHRACTANKVWNDCGTCEATCDNPNPMCAQVCKAGCFCPKDTKGMPMVYDAAKEKCISPSSCPKGGQCENRIAENFEDTGAAAAKCAKFDNMAVCVSPGCISQKCVPKKDWVEDDYMSNVCAAFSQELCGKKPIAPNLDKQQEGCKWATGQGKPASFICSDGAWAAQGEGSCNAGGGFEEEICDYISESNCYNNQECDTSLLSKCGGLAKTVYSTCTLACFGGVDDECRKCLDNGLFGTKTIDGVRPDLFTCCGCLDQSLGAIGLTPDQVKTVVVGRCGGGDDDDDWYLLDDYDYDDDADDKYDDNYEYSDDYDYDYDYDYDDDDKVHSTTTTTKIH